MAPLAPLAALVLVACPGPKAPDIPPCGPDTLSTAPLLDMLDITAVGPMGGVDPWRGQVFPNEALSFFIRPVDPRLPQGETARVPVVAPARLWLQLARHTGSPDEFIVSFRTCADVSWTLKHLAVGSPIVEALSNSEQATPSGGGTSFSVGTNAGIEVAAGTELGLAGGSNNLSLDVSTFDFRSPPVMFANGLQERFTCPLESFDPAIADALRPLLGTPDGRRRTAQPSCGEYMQDVRDTAQGIWQDDTNSTRFALVHDSVDPELAVISVSAYGESHRWRFPPTHSGNVNRDFGEVTHDGTPYCYDASSGGDLPSIVLVEVEGPNRLLFEIQDATACGTGPWTFHLPYGFSFVRGFPGGGL
ncbi:MAG TPA: hypothetical protein VFA20_30925 [Myxococcaceae bacterium]|nr:hypothetical protein [Myxococcaceae bacterium]